MAAPSNKVLTSTVNSDEINYLVFRYLQESGYVHAAFTFGYESHVCKSKIDGSQIPPGALLSFVQRGVNFVEIEESITVSGENVPAPSSAMDGTTSLLDVHRCLCSDNFKKGKPDRATAALGKNNGPGSSTVAASSTAVAVAVSTAADLSTTPPAENDMDIDAAGGKEAAPEPAGNGIVIDPNKSLEVSPADVLVLKGHRSEVFVCAWNPRTAVLASGSGDSTARIWPIPASPQVSLSAATAAATQPIILQHYKPSHLSDGTNRRSRNDVTTMDWNKSGTRLATGSYDGCTRIWTESGELKHTLSLHKGPLFSLKWNKEGNYLLSGSVDRTTAVWDTETGQCVKHFKVHSAPTLDVDWRDDTSFASCSTDKMIYLCSLYESGPIRAYEGHRDEINCVRFDHSSSLLASCSDDHTAKVWSVSSSTPIYDLREHTKEVYTMRWSPSTFRRLVLATASFDATVKLWDINTGRCMQTLAGHTDPVYSLDFSPNGDYLASGSFDRCLCIWSVKDGKLLKKYRGTGGIFEVTWNGAGDKVAACFSSNCVSVIDFRKL
jgi:transducin (beta)-like 1